MSHSALPFRSMKNAASTSWASLAFVLLAGADCDPVAPCQDDNPCTDERYVESTNTCEYSARRGASCELDGQPGVCGGVGGRICEEIPPSTSGRIAFDSDRDGNGDIYVINADGTGPLVNMSYGTARDYDEPAWSPDGTRVVYDAGRAHFIIASYGSRTSLYTADNILLDAKSDEPSWSVRDLIAFDSDRDGDREIYVVPLSGGDPEQLTFNDAEDETASWSPDGFRILFQSDREGNMEIFLMSADGSNVVNLTNNSASDEEPSWSPDGSQIVFVSNRTGDSDEDMEVYVMEFDDPSNIVQLTDNDVLDDEPVFSPDGTKIAFSSERDGPSNIYVMDADGSNVRAIVESPAEDEDPAWTN